MGILLLFEQEIAGCGENRWTSVERELCLSFDQHRSTKFCTTFGELVLIHSYDTMLYLSKHEPLRSVHDLIKTEMKIPVRPTWEERSWFLAAFTMIDSIVSRMPMKT